MADPQEILQPQEFEYLRHCGDEAVRWLAEFHRRECGVLRESLRQALKTLKRGNLAAARERLASIERSLQERPAGFPSLDHLLNRHYQSIVAYYHYLSGDLAAARESLGRAHEEIRRVVSSHGFLRAVAMHCVDIFTQLTRVARRGNEWRQVQHYLAVLAGIYVRDQPLCVLGSGEAVRMSDVRRFFAALPLNEEDRRRATALLGDRRPPEEHVLLLEESIYTLPDFVIPYP